jgi:hypothetical protein
MPAVSSSFFHFPSRACLISILGLLLFCWTVAGPASAAPPAGPAQASGPYALDGQIDFNVLDQVEYDPQTRKLVLLGHQDDKYDTPAIPYLQYLATLLDQPNPEFSLNWTPDSERRVDELFRRLDSDEERGKLEREWITWTDNSQHVTRTGRIFLEMFGVTPPDEGPGNTWDSMEHDLFGKPASTFPDHALEAVCDCVDMTGGARRSLAPTAIFLAALGLL